MAIGKRGKRRGEPEFHERSDGTSLTYGCPGRHCRGIDQIMPHRDEDYVQLHTSRED